MFILYPSNKLEHLSVLLAAVLKHQPSSPFTADKILVESPGMQHWVSMELARLQGVAMNLSFPLPTRFLWDIARAVLGNDIVPQQSPYRREVLLWRIDRIIKSTAVVDNPVAHKMSQFWQMEVTPSEQGIKRLQLAMNLADAFEQYLIYRPDWLFAWEQGKENVTGNEDEAWQALVWRELVAEDPNHPARLHQKAMEVLASNSSSVASLLPERLVVFAINTMAPQLIEFLDLLAKHIDIHFFHLNPCVNYWGNSISNKAQAKILREQGIEAWLNEEQSNPLLANLGRQGRDLFNLLTQIDTFELSAFDDAVNPEQPSDSQLLSKIHQDIFLARTPEKSEQQCDLERDSSLYVSQSHSALREVQALHDFLLHQMNDDPTLLPRDVVVMCPAIEDYASIVEAVFQTEANNYISGEQQAITRIPCSIADRAPIDADPLVAGFIDLLLLPDSRFEVIHIINYLRLPAVQKKFNILDEHLDSMIFLLQKAHIHWGLDGSHKAAVTEGATHSDRSSWKWGFHRLLIGMACEDHPVLSESMLTVPDVEGKEAEVLGRLMSVIDTLDHHAQALVKCRSMKEWRSCLLSLRNDCFEAGEDYNEGWESIGAAIGDLEEHCIQAHYDDTLHLTQVRSIILQRLSAPDRVNHFMTGKVTFCSMMPMRNIPFRVVAILGLNDGEFPRQNQINSINIMQNTQWRLGDRSRRFEDRYLFLEALLSARKTLYLSYQGRNATDNSQRQPSLVLQELMAYLYQGYGWEQKISERVIPLQPFSANNFNGNKPSFSKGWLRLAKCSLETANTTDKRHLSLDNLVLPTVLSAVELARMFDNPLRYFAEHQLDIRLTTSNAQLDEFEPFDTDKLTEYQITSAMLEAAINNEEPKLVEQRFFLDGLLPDNALYKDQIQKKLAGVEAFSHVIENFRSALASEHSSFNFKGNHLTFTSALFEAEQGLVAYHGASSQNNKRQLQYWLAAVIAWANGVQKSLKVYYLSDDDKTSVRCGEYQPITQSDAQGYLSKLEEIIAELLSKPSIFHSTLAHSFLNDKGVNKGSTTIEQWWRQQSSVKPSVLDDDYFIWFFPTPPTANELPLESWRELYLPIYQHYKDAKVGAK